MGHLGCVGVVGEAVLSEAPDEVRNNRRSRVLALLVFTISGAGACGRVAEDGSPKDEGTGGAGTGGAAGTGGELGTGGSNDGGGGMGGAMANECEPGTFDDGGDCSEWRDCQPGRYVESVGTPVSDRECEDCPPGTFSTEENVEVCQEWTPCPPFQTVIIDGRDDRDQTCDLLYPARVSLLPGNVQFERESMNPLVSNEGRYVFFDYPGTDIDPLDTNEATDVYRVDFTTGEIMRVSLGAEGQEGNGPSEISAISPSGDLLLFTSYADNLVEGDENGEADVFLRDIDSGTTILVSMTPEGAPASGASYGSTISPDGQYVLFSSEADDIVDGDDNGQRDAFLRHVMTQITVLVSVGTDGTLGNSYSGGGDISADARYVTFSSTASNLVAGDTNGEYDVFLRDLFLDTTIRISVSSTGEQGDYMSSGGSISADGSTVLFTSFAQNLVEGDTNGTADAFLYDVASGETTQVSVNSLEVPANDWSAGSGLSADGEKALVLSTATTLLAGNSDFTNNLFVRNLTLGTTSWVSPAYDGAMPNGPLVGASMSPDGSFVVYVSQADNLVPGDTNQTDDIFVFPVP